MGIRLGLQHEHKVVELGVVAALYTWLDARFAGDPLHAQGHYWRHVVVIFPLVLEKESLAFNPMAHICIILVCS